MDLTKRSARMAGLAGSVGAAVFGGVTGPEVCLGWVTGFRTCAEVIETENKPLTSIKNQRINPNQLIFINFVINSPASLGSALLLFMVM
jgi:hypothetical protein